MPAMTGAERVRKHRARLYREREAKIRAIWNPSMLPRADLARLLDWLANAAAADIAAFLAGARPREDWREIFAPPEPEARRCNAGRDGCPVTGRRNAAAEAAEADAAHQVCEVVRAVAWCSRP